eukprot:CAMPEP_0178402220 /NCGR_PEP_ID=MMETSP0689_2-20121128/16721_1 /TAXON_ID=160604 /ORGANISM="Amphidinium massartii, Strain CS-259" /LENGTH=678 /DNA_ID=CAMNT_0020023097 /DNA_START=350 /DNA_END=2384 /DNA_ORIENTATION=+
MEIGRTQSHWGGHLHPVWEHTCQPFLHESFCEVLKVSVFEENFGGLKAATFCGEASSPVPALLQKLRHGAGQNASADVEFEIQKRGETTGKVHLQILLREPPPDGSLRTRSAMVPEDAEESYASVDASQFKLPVERLGVSGGTAPFFRLQLRDPSDGRSTDYWIGKDLSRAMDEIAFYEDRRLLLLEGLWMDTATRQLLDFMFEYDGVVEVQTAEDPEGEAKQLLVLRNLRDGKKHLRMLDIKVGEKTASAGWKGKSRVAALRQSTVDAVTNSSTEGFRLEGFDGQPPVLGSMDPLLDIVGEKLGGEAIRKRWSKAAARMQLQLMPASKMLMHFLDLHQHQAEAGGAALDVSKTLHPIEVAEVVGSEMVKKLIHLAVACRQHPVPQKWIGSSVALGFDDHSLPSRSTPEKEVRQGVLVYIFDWGRSELNSLTRNSKLSPQEQADRVTYWRYYTGGIDRLAWEAASAYARRFCSRDGWNELEINVYDFDSMLSEDYIGKATIPVHSSKGSVSLVDKHGATVKGRDGPAELTYSMAWQPLPSSSRLIGMWRVKIAKATNLPACDGTIAGVDIGGIIGRPGTCDPFAVVTAIAADGRRSFSQQTCVITKDVNPVWNETFDLPVARHDLLAEACHMLLNGKRMSSSKMDDLLIHPGGTESTTSARSTTAGDTGAGESLAAFR